MSGSKKLNEKFKLGKGRFWVLKQVTGKWDQDLDLTVVA